MCQLGYQAGKPVATNVVMNRTKQKHVLTRRNSGDRHSVLCRLTFRSYNVLIHGFPMQVEMFELNTKDSARVDRNNRVINLDANANTATTGVVIDAVTAALREAGNPSSTHEGGAIARRILTDACDAVSSLVSGASDEAVIFTSGCTEANNTVLRAAFTMGATLVTTEVEHPSVLATAHALSSQGVSVSVIGVDADGVIRLDDLEAALGSIDGPVVLSIQSANSETGVMQPIAAIADLLADRADVLFHSDAAQSFGKIPVRVGRGAPDVVSISGHKRHAPMGIGAVISRQSSAHQEPTRGCEAVAIRRYEQRAGFGPPCRAWNGSYVGKICRTSPVRVPAVSAG